MTYGPTRKRDEFDEDYLAERVRFLMSKVEKKGEHWIFTGAGDGNGYGKLRIVLPSGKVWYPKAHAFSYLVHRGDLIERMDVCHKCSEKRCVNPDHLYLGTRSENLIDAGRDGTARYHGKPPRLKEEAVRQLRSLYRDGNFKTGDIADMFGIDQQAVSMIGRNLTYQWVT